MSHERWPAGFLTSVTAQAVIVALVFTLVFPAGLSASGPADPRPEDEGVSPARAAAAAERLAEHVPGELIVRLRPGTSAAKAASAHARAGVAASHETLGKRSRLQRVNLKKGVGVGEAQAKYRRSPEFEYVQPNYVYHAATAPDDPYFPMMWGLHNTGQTGGTPDTDIDAPEAWESQTGTGAVIVADIDTGAEYTHPDLAGNIWTNPGEIPGNGLDDDSNGFVDDVHGYDFVNNDGDPSDDHGHGTHTAGTIGAKGDNGSGVTGVCWDVRIMVLKFLDAAGNGDTANAVRALDYATMMGADLTNNSWGGGGYDQALYDAIRDNGTLFVGAAGNDTNNNDIVPGYPSSFDLPNILAVAATDANDVIAPFSSFGKHTVDVAAPGVGIWSTARGGSYVQMNGTSMATPHVSGIAALLLSELPGLTPAELRQAIEDSVDEKSSLSMQVATGGRVNAAAALALVKATSWPAGAALKASAISTSSLDLAWPQVWGAQGYRLYDGETQVATVAPDPASFHLAGLTPGSSHSFSVQALMRDGSWTSDGPTAGVTMLTSAGMTIEGGAAWATTTTVSVDSVVDGAASLRFADDSPWVSVATGAYHSVGVKADGSLYAWGANSRGQIGDGTTVTRPSPTRIGLESDWATAAAGELHSLAIKRDGSLWAWGSNSYGGLGDGTTVQRLSPVRVGGDNDWVAVSAGWQYTIAMKRDGSGYAWGYNGEGELGDGTFVNKSSPSPTGSGWTWTSLACGDSHTIAVRSDGYLYGWGWNYYGQVGDNTVMNRSAPVRIGTEYDWAAVSAGYYHSLGVKRDGSLYAWGHNGFLQLGDGTWYNRLAPKRIGLENDWAKPAAGGFHSLATKIDGSLWAWGYNNNGQLGDGSRVERWGPERTGTDTGWAAIASCDAHATGIRDGQLLGWGYSAHGQSGDGGYDDRLVPTLADRGWYPWQTYGTSVTATLPPGDGPKTVSGQYRSASGDVLTFSDDIVLDATPPVTSSDATASYTGEARISLAATDGLSGVAATRYSLDGSAWATGTSVIVSAVGTHTLEFRSTDRAGNIEATAGVTFAVEQAPPTLTPLESFPAPDQGYMFDHAHFGESVDVEGDTAVVASIDHVYVYGRHNGHWTLDFDVPTFYDVALSADAVALSGDTFARIARNEGFVQIFRRAAGGWVQEAQIDVRAVAVALEGDVMALLVDNAIRVYTRSGVTWGLSQTLDLDPSFSPAYRAIAIDGSRIAAGSGEGTAAAVHVFNRAGATWAREAMIPAEAGADLFGAYSLALDGDTMLISSYGQGAFAYRFGDGGWASEGQLLPATSAWDVGEGVALNGDIALVGAGAAHETTTSSGAVWVYRRSGNDWAEVTRLVGLPETLDDGGNTVYSEFGAAMALDEGTALIGGFHENRGHGGVHLYSLTGPPPTVVTGTLTGLAGEPLERMVVSAYDANTHAFVKAVFTDAVGRYALAGLPAGSYHLRFLTASGTAVGGYPYYALKRAISEATTVSVGAGEIVTASQRMQAAPPPAPTGITGTLTNGATPLPGVVVSAFDATTKAYVKGVFTNSSGVYSLPLPSGTYRLRFTNTVPSSLAQYYDQKVTIDQAAVVTVGASGMTAVNSDLAPLAPPVTQAITGTITNGGVPLPNVVVTAFDAVTKAHVKGVFTNAAGVYMLALPAGTYRLRFTNTTPATLSQYYDHTVTIDAATPVVLASGVNTTVNSDLAP